MVDMNTTRRATRGVSLLAGVSLRKPVITLQSQSSIGYRFYANEGHGVTEARIVYISFMMREFIGLYISLRSTQARDRGEHICVIVEDYAAA